MANIDLLAFHEREAQGLMRKVDVKALQSLVEQGYLTSRSHPHADLLIWNYTAKTQFEHYWTPETMMCRGLITRSDGEIVARSFSKFFNIEEIKDIPLEPFSVTEKVDGSLLIVALYQDQQVVATRGSFTSEQAIKGAQILAEKYATFSFPKDFTYLYEVIYSSNRVVVDYGDMEDIILLAVIETATGKELDIHAGTWPFPVVKRYDGMTDIAALRSVEEENKEGFVIRFESGLRVKAKFAEYVRLHKLLTQINARVIWQMLREGQSLDELLSRVPDEFYAWVRSTQQRMVEQAEEIERECQALYCNVVGLPTRKEQAAIVVAHPYSDIVFKMLDGKAYADQIWKRVRPSAEKPFREDEG